MHLAVRLVVCLVGLALAADHLPVPPLPIRNGCVADSECPEQWICSTDGFCSDPTVGVVARVVPVHWLVGVCLGAAVIIAVLWMVVGQWLFTGRRCCYACTDPSWVNSAIVAGAVICSVTTMVVLGVSANMVAEQIAATPRGLTNGVACNDTWALACAPYACSTPAAQCWSSCTADAQCASPTVCSEAGICVTDSTFARGPIPGLTTYLLDTRLGVVAMIAVSAGLGGAILLTAACMRARRGRRFCTDENCHNGWQYIALFMTSWIIIALALGVATKPLSFPSPGSGDACTVHAQCAPYFCDTTAGKCRVGCTENAHCQDPMECTSGGCQAPQDNVAYTTLTPAIAAAIAAGSATTFCVAVYLPLVLCVRLKERSPCVGCAVRGSWLLATIVLFLVIFLPSAYYVHVDVTSNSARDDTECSALEAVACEPYLCQLASRKCFIGCSGDHDCMHGAVCQQNQCRAEGTSDAVLRPWVGAVAGITVGACLMMCVRCLVRNSSWHCADRVVMMVGVAVVGGLICGVLASLGSVGTELTTQMRDMTTCVSLLAGQCAPFVCDVRKAVCLASCLSDDECVTGALCLGGTVVLHNTTSGNITRIPDTAKVCTYSSAVPAVEPVTASIAWGAIWLIVCGAVVALVVRQGLGARDPCGGCLAKLTKSDTREETRNTAECFAIGGVLLVMAFGIAIFYSTSLYAPSGTSSNTLECGTLQAAQCAPYYCNVPSGVCYAEGSCTKDTDCHPGHVCTAGSCVARSYRTHLIASSVVAGVALIVGVVYIWLVLRGLWAGGGPEAAATTDGEERPRKGPPEVPGIRRKGIPTVPTIADGPAAHNFETDEDSEEQPLKPSPAPVVKPMPRSNSNSGNMSRSNSKKPNGSPEVAAIPLPRTSSKERTQPSPPPYEGVPPPPRAPPMPSESTSEDELIVRSRRGGLTKPSPPPGPPVDTPAAPPAPSPAAPPLKSALKSTSPPPPEPAQPPPPALDTESDDEPPLQRPTNSSERSRPASLNWEADARIMSESHDELTVKAVDRGSIGEQSLRSSSNLSEIEFLKD